MKFTLRSPRILLSFGLYMLLLASYAQDTLTEAPLPEKYATLEKYNKPIEFVYDDVSVAAICTGYISTDNKFPEPVFVWLIKTPGANYLIDAGLSPKILNKNYFQGISSYFFKNQFTFYMYKSNNLLLQLERLKIPVSTIKVIFLTHAHFDHIGYLPELKKIKVVMTKKERDEVNGSGQLAGYQKNTDDIVGTDRTDAMPLEHQGTQKINEQITLLRTDNHTKGHQMILLNTPKGKVLFTGDVNMKILDTNCDLYKFIGSQVDMKTCTFFFNHDIDLK
jgi:glyoxylase-like metal-dependent hydrolase (beta-lactamase superfamily II)